MTEGMTETGEDLVGEEEGFLVHPLIRFGAVEYRSYQADIASTAAERNTLVILPTALGKTVIAAIAVAETLYRYRESRVLVMAPTRPLVLQHHETFHRILKLGEEDMAILTGETPPGLRRGVWKAGARLLFATPQVVRNDLLDGRLSLEGVGLLVFDECHRAVGRYAYTEIAEFYAEQVEYPLLLGMTASPGSKLERIKGICRDLYIEQVEYRSEEDPDVEPYIQPIEVEQRTVSLPWSYRAARAQIKDMLDQRLRVLHRKGVLTGSMEYTGRRRLLEAGEDLRYRLEMSMEEELGGVYRDIVTQSLALTLYHMLELLETQGMHTLRAFMDRVEEQQREKRSYAILASSGRYQALKELVDKHQTLHPKARLLMELVEEELASDPSNRMLVFTQYRDTASHLTEMLNQLPGTSAARFVGQANRQDDEGLSQQDQARRIRMLRDGALNLLVCTSIGEEGLDIPSVDHVYFYEPRPSGIRYIQRRGRTGRRRGGRATILAAEETLDMPYLYASRRRIRKMRRIVSSVNRWLPEITRTKSRPPRDTMTKEELEQLEEGLTPIEAGETAMLSWERAAVAEAEAAREERKQVDRAARTLYTMILERGARGATLQQLANTIEKGEEVETQEWAIRAGLEQLMEKEAVSETEGERYAVTSALKSYGETHQVRVDRLHRGYAEVTVDGEVKAKLAAEEYSGPRTLLKKGEKFTAIAELYGDPSNTHIWVKEIKRKLS